MQVGNRTHPFEPLAIQRRDPQIDMGAKRKPFFLGRSASCHGQIGSRKTQASPGRGRLARNGGDDKAGKLDAPTSVERVSTCLQPSQWPATLGSRIPWLELKGFCSSTGSWAAAPGTRLAELRLHCWRTRCPRSPAGPIFPSDDCARLCHRPNLGRT
ncbi:uncharacterized protein B0I36DRAFT_4219 [Microdochium trichocladiopsis]|uniref:Uncharacterized protein n=1 Tax=Microdochium trichocladiopsis TaxID=1682393 RepID=A0A9P9BV56_9PEZI|nr:uncharacterized protein B0I36DRAFT_4219 [Microdochium trichocladiopsis]KAH7039988.1 hypothetical protein B0I36DRAFT_4219 [Microdochium trichocladiopsis]